MTGSAFPRARAPVWRVALLTALAYGLACRFGLLLAIPPGHGAPVWPAAGLALAAAVRLKRAGVAGVALGALAFHILSSDGAGAATAAAFGAALQAAVGAWLLRRFAAFPFAGATPVSLAKFFLFGGLVASVVAPSVGLIASPGLEGAGPWRILMSWAQAWSGDAAGAAVFGAALLSFEGATARAALRRAAPVLATAVCALAGTFGVVWIDVADVQRGVRADFELLAHEFATRLEATVSLGVHAVDGLAGNFSTPHERDLTDFKALADKLAAFGLGIQALEWIPRVPASQREAYELAMSRQWGQPFKLTAHRGGKPVPVEARDVYFPVGFVTPLKGNEGAVGYDLASNPARNAALVKARDSGASVASAGVKLVQNNEMGILLFTPVYAAGAPTGTVEERRNALSGFALGVFSTPDLVRVALRASDTSMLDYWLTDITDASAPTLLASDAAEKPHDFNLSSSSLFAASAPLGEKLNIRVADRTWSFRLSPNADYIAKHGDSSPYWLLLGGLALTALAVASVLVMVGRQHQLIDSRERDLENQKFALDQHAIVSITDARGVISYANDRFCEISGYTRERLIGANHNIVKSGRQDRAFYAALWGALRAGAVWRGEICNKSAEGDLYWLDATIVPLKDRKGGVQEFIAICTDITARKSLEQELESSRSFLQSVTDSMGEGVYTIDRHGKCTFLNAEAERLLGWTFEEVRGQRLHDLVHYQDSAGAHIHASECAIMHGLRAARKHVSEDQVFTHRDGRVFPVSTVAVRLERDGAIVGAVVVFQDITERRRVLEELAASEQRLSIALSASSTGLWDYNPITDRAIYSDTWFRMLGYEPRSGAQTGETFRSLLHPDDCARYQEAMDKHASGETAAFEIEFRMRRADGEWAWIRSVGRIIERDGAGYPSRLIGIHSDTTAAHRSQAELAEAKDVAVRASQAKSDFLATMSHEIRTPMNAIIGLSHLFARTDMNPRQRDYLTKIQNASQALLAIINDILDFSKIEAGKLTIESVDFELEKVLDGVMTVIAPKIAEKGLSLVVERAPALPNDFVGDPLRLSQLLTNLLSNSTKFTSKGEVRVTLGGEPQPDGRFRLEVSVADTGIGMSEAQLALLFRPFTQADASTSRRFGGTGLGLAICQQIVNLMGGDISVRSVEGVGTTFTFHAPLTVGARARLAEQERAALSGRRVLVVEDSRSTRRMLCAALAEWGVEVVEATTGDEALQAAAQSGPFDLVTLDWRLPDIDGVETLVSLREAGVRSAALMLTAYGKHGLKDELARRFGEAGQSIFVLEKPVPPRALKEAALAALGHSVAADPPAPRAVRQASDVLLPGVMVLLVEDNPINQQVATELLEALGVETTVAGSGEEALEILATREFDLILMDMQMPGRDGLETTQAIRTEIGDTRTPIVAMTANAMVGDRERCLEAGMNDHLAKPIDPDRLALTLAHWLEGRSRAASEPRAAKAQPAPQGRVAGVDVEAALHNLGGNTELFEGLLDIFVEEHRDQSDTIARAAAQGEWKRVNAIAHGLKGAASTLGATRVTEAARAIEQAAREASPDGEAIALQTETLGHALAELVEGVAAHKLAAPAAETGEDLEAPPTAAELLPSIEALQRLIEAGDADAETQSEELARRLSRTAAGPRASAVALSASRYDFDDAAASLAELRAEVENWS